MCSADLKEVSAVARLAANNLVSIGSSLSHVHVPGRDVTDLSEEDLTESEVEVGMGMSLCARSIIYFSRPL